MDYERGPYALFHKLGLDKTFVEGSVEFEYKKIWIQEKGMHDVFSKKKQIVLEIIDYMRKKDGSSRHHVARELDVLMAERKLSVSKMWNNWRKTGKVV